MLSSPIEEYLLTNLQGITTVSDQRDLRGLNLVAAHSHIRGLGVDEDSTLR